MVELDLPLVHRALLDKAMLEGQAAAAVPRLRTVVVVVVVLEPLVALLHARALPQLATAVTA